jgi:hypothetical protein
MDSWELSRPSFFQIYMESKLRELLKESFRFILRTVIESYSSFTHFRYYFKQIADAGIVLLDIFCMKRYNSTFTERFYGLKREWKGSIYTQLLKYTILNILPYTLNNLPSRIRNIILAIKSCIDAVFKIQYLYRSGKFYSSSYYILNNTLTLSKQTYLNLPLLIVISLMKILEIYLSIGKNRNVQDVQDVPHPFNNSQVRKGVCGICRGSVVNPAVLVVSGYMYCYTCIKDHIDTYSTCPVTSTPATSSSIRRIIC